MSQHLRRDAVHFSDVPTAVTVFGLPDSSVRAMVRSWRSVERSSLHLAARTCLETDMAARTETGRHGDELAIVIGVAAARGRLVDDAYAYPMLDAARWAYLASTHGADLFAVHRDILLDAWRRARPASGIRFASPA